MSNLGPDQSQAPNPSLDAEASSGIFPRNDAVDDDNSDSDAAQQEAVQTLDDQGAAASSPASEMDAEIQADVRTLDSRNLDSHRPPPSTNATGPTFWDAATGGSGLMGTSGRSRDAAQEPEFESPRSRPASNDRYVLLENFAHGGLGNLWRAEDTAIRREVAFKELLPKALRNPIQIERFVEEAQISGQLEHPGIIPIYDVGFRENGTPYYTMKLVRGGSMEVAIEAMHKLPPGSPERQLAFHRLLRQFIAVCQAVGFAHEKGVLHRDLKPQNVMLGEFGETLVLDWGLAKLVDLIGEQMISSDRSTRPTADDELIDEEGQSEVATVLLNESLHPDAPADPASPAPSDKKHLDVTQDQSPEQFTATGQATAKSIEHTAGFRTFQASTATATGQRPVQTGMRSAGSQTLMGQVMGTPAYMSPEQALGLIDELDSRSDIYSLGGILYRLLTNKQPVGRGKVQAVLDKVILGLIAPPRTIDASIPKSLEAICLKAMSKEKQARYPKALELAADVEAWLSDQPVSAYPDPWRTRARRWAKQHRTFVVSLSATILVIVCGAALWEWSVTRRMNAVQKDVLAKIGESRSAISQSKFVRAKEFFDAASGIVAAEPNLGPGRLSILRPLLAAAESDRLSGIQNNVDLELAEVQRAIHDRQDFTQAKTILTHIASLLEREPSLTNRQQSVQTHLKAVEDYERFREEVELARIFGGNISGDESLDDIRESKRHALVAREIFESDADRPDYAGERLQSLGNKAIAQWRDGMQEVLVTLAYLETKLAIRDDPDVYQKAARQSLEHLREAEQLGFSSQPMWYLKADLFRLLNRPDEAQAAQRTAETLTPKTRLDHYLLGEFKRGQGKYKEARSHFQDALQVDPNDFWSLNMLGLCQFQMEQYDAVISSCTACIARRPDFDWPYLARGVAYGKTGEFEKAHQDIAKALDLKPQSYHAYLNRGVIHAYQKNYTAAQANFERASQRKPEQAAPFLNLAAVGLERANALLIDSQQPNASVLAAAELQQANVALTAAIERSPQQAAIYSFRGRIRLAQGNMPEALADFEKANNLEVVPRRRSENFHQIGNVHFRAGQMAAALAAYDHSIEENPANISSLLQRAETHLELKHFAEAERDFTNALKLAGPGASLADAYRGRSMALTALKKPREAINDYTMSLQYEPAPNMLARRGWAYLLDAAKLAKEDFEEAIRANPDDPDFYQGLAYAKVTLGDYTSAVADLDTSLIKVKPLIAKHGSKAWQYLFNPATVLAQAHDKALTDAKVAPERRGELAREYTEKAVELLLQARQLAGPQFQKSFVNALRTDPALDPIRQSPEYLKALKNLDPELAATLESKNGQPSQKP